MHAFILMSIHSIAHSLTIIQLLLMHSEVDGSHSLPDCLLPTSSQKGLGLALRTAQWQDWTAGGARGTRIVALLVWPAGERVQFQLVPSCCTNRETEAFNLHLPYSCLGGHLFKAGPSPSAASGGPSLSAVAQNT